MFYKVFALSFLISAVAAELTEGVYRIINPEIITISSAVARSGAEVGTPVVLALSQPPSSDLHELWVVRRVRQSPANYYTLENIGQDYGVYATDLGEDPNFVFTGPNQQSYYIESVDDGNYAIYRSNERAEAWTAPSQLDYPISVEGVGTQGQTWKFVSALNE